LAEDPFEPVRKRRRPKWDWYVLNFRRQAQPLASFQLRDYLGPEQQDNGSNFQADQYHNDGGQGAINDIDEG